LVGPACEAPAWPDALARRNAEQGRRPPHQVAFEFGDVAVGMDDPPHHLHETAHHLNEAAVGGLAIKFFVKSITPPK
jgi:hypothetical protein